MGQYTNIQHNITALPIFHPFTFDMGEDTIPELGQGGPKGRGGFGILLGLSIKLT